MDPRLILLPIGLVCYFLPIPYAGLVSRGMLLVAVSGGFSRLGLLRRVEARWIVLLGLYLMASATSLLFSIDMSLSLMDFARQIYIVVFSILLVLTLRRSSARTELAAGMLLPTLLGIAVILYLFQTRGWGFSTDELHTFKASVSASDPSLAMNPIAGLFVLTFLASMPVSFRFRHLTWLFIAIFFPVLVLTGARSTIVALPSAVLLFMIVRVLWRMPLFPRLIAIAFLITLSIAVCVSIRIPSIPIESLDKATTHRVYLWEAALERFSSHYWFGAGADTWRLDLATVLPAEPQWVSRALLQLSSGAYHNAYLAFLAERGLVVSIPALLFLWFVLRSAFRVYAHRKMFAPVDRGLAQLAPTMVLFIMVRQLGECSGLLGYAEGTTDFASFVVASLVIALAADIGHCDAYSPNQGTVISEDARVVNENGRAPGLAGVVAGV